MGTELGTMLGTGGIVEEWSAAAPQDFYSTFPSLPRWPVVSFAMIRLGLFPLLARVPDERDLNGRAFGCNSCLGYSFQTCRDSGGTTPHLH